MVAVRQAVGLAQEQRAATLGIKQPSLSRLESHRGANAPQLRQLVEQERPAQAIGDLHQVQAAVVDHYGDQGTPDNISRAPDITLPLVKPTRLEALEYYRRVSEHYNLHICQYQWVKTITGEDGNFRVTATDRQGHIHDYCARKIIVATGYYDLPNRIGIPGEELNKVFHYYREAHPYFDTDVVVIGGKNSAAEAALDLWRHGARVTLVYRGTQIHNHVKYWVRPDIENRIKAGEITAYFNSTVQEIGPDFVVVKAPDGTLRLQNDFVFALTGYHPDYDFLTSVGIELSAEQHRPFCDPETLESNAAGIYVAGVIVAGSRTNEIFIENGRFHGKQIAAHLRDTLGRRRAAS